MTQLVSREEGRALLASQGKRQPRKASSASPAARTPAPTTPVPPSAPAAGTEQRKGKGPARVGHWELYRATGLDYCRLVVQGPPEEFERMKAHILAYQPA